ncbi:MAG: TetR/AcrR family transcriptional regulator [Polyangiaceae bacterium]|nr:TetR/AcrR family transcriptional regulator [Polyangiaceae bacterium]
MILDAAKTLFAQNGYHHTNIDNICDQLEISRGTVYLYFNNRKDVFLAIVEEAMERLKASSARTKTRDKRSKDKAASFRDLAGVELTRTLEALFEDEPSIRILLQVAPGIHPEIDALLRQIDDLAVDRFTSFLRASQKDGLVDLDIDPRKIAVFTIGGAQKLVLDTVVKRGKKPDIASLAAESIRMSLGR